MLKVIWFYKGSPVRWNSGRECVGEQGCRWEEDGVAHTNPIASLKPAKVTQMSENDVSIECLVARGIDRFFWLTH